MSDVIGYLRAVTARRSALAAYQQFSEAHSERETHLLMVGYDHAAAKHHAADLILLRALLAEQDDPEPVEPA